MFCSASSLPHIIRRPFLGCLHISAWSRMSEQRVLANLARKWWNRKHILDVRANICLQWNLEPSFWSLCLRFREVKTFLSLSPQTCLCSRAKLSFPFSLAGRMDQGASCPGNLQVSYFRGSFAMVQSHWPSTMANHLFHLWSKELMFPVRRIHFHMRGHTHTHIHTHQVFTAHYKNI